MLVLNVSHSKQELAKLKQVQFLLFFKGSLERGERQKQAVSVNGLGGVSSLFSSVRRLCDVIAWVLTQRWMCSVQSW